MKLSINNLKFIIKILADIAIVYISLYLAIIINAEKFLPISKSYLALGFIIISIQITTFFYFLMFIVNLQNFFDNEKYFKDFNVCF